MAKTKKKRFKIRGRVVKVYDPREVEVYGTTKEVSDVELKLENGKKIKVSFWDQDVSGIEGCKVLITYVVDKGVFRGMKQYSSTKDTEVEVLEKSKKAVDDDAEEVDEDEELAEPDDSEEEDDEEEEEEEKPKKKKMGRKPKKAKKSSDAEVDEDTVELVTALATKAWEICEEVAPENVADDAQAYRALFGNIFTTLGTKDYYAKQ